MNVASVDKVLTSSQICRRAYFFYVQFGKESLSYFLETFGSRCVFSNLSSLFDTVKRLVSAGASVTAVSEVISAVFLFL